MKKIEAILGPCAVTPVRDLLFSHGYRDIVVSDVNCAESNGACAHCHRGVDYESGAPQLKLETTVEDGTAMSIAHSILTISHHHDGSDEAVSACPLDGVFSIRISNLGDTTTPGGEGNLRSL